MKMIRLHECFPDEIITQLGPAHSLVKSGDVLVVGGALVRAGCGFLPGLDIDLLTTEAGLSKLRELLEGTGYHHLFEGNNKESNTRNGHENGSLDDPISRRIKYTPNNIAIKVLGWRELDIMVLKPCKTLVLDAEEFLKTFDAAIAQQLLYYDADGVSWWVASKACLDADALNVPGWRAHHDIFTTTARREKWDKLMPGY